MRRHVQASHREIGPVLEEASPLFVQRQEVETKTQILGAFTEHFLISDEDLETLTSMSVPIDDAFFLLLSRLKKIHADCQILLGTENQQLGLELMEKSSRSLNMAYQKLFRWIQRDFRSLNLENPQISASIRRSLRVLAERPTLFQNILDFFAEAREHSLSASFYAALTGTSTSDQDIQTPQDLSTKPIEYYAHDPLRFVGDMLAWTHSATVSEREALETLFIAEGPEIAAGIRSGFESDPWSRLDGDIDNAVFDGQRSLEQLVNRDLSGVARVLHQRIEQVIASDTDPVLAYKIANLIDFYRITFVRLLGSNSSVLDTLSRLRDSAFARFRASMQSSVATVQAEIPQHTAGLSSEDLAIPDFLADCLGQVTQLMKSHDASLAPAETSREAAFVPVLVEALDPYLEACETIAASLEEPATSIFTINCLFAAKSTLETHISFTTERVAELDDTVEEHAAKLAEYQHAFFLHNSGLYPFVAALAPLSPDEEVDVRSAVRLDVLKEQSIKEASQTLDEFLPSAFLDALENLKELVAKGVAKAVTTEGAGRFAEDFGWVEGWVERVDAWWDEQGREKGGESSGDEWGNEKDARREEREKKARLRDLFPRTQGEIRVLLS